MRSVRPCNNTWGADTIGYTRTGYLLELRIHHPNPTRYICEIIKQYEVYCLLFWKHINPTEHTKLFSLSLAQIRVYHRETRVERAGTLPEGLFLTNLWKTLPGRLAGHHVTRGSTIESAFSSAQKRFSRRISNSISNGKADINMDSCQRRRNRLETCLKKLRNGDENNVFAVD